MAVIEQEARTVSQETGQPRVRRSWAGWMLGALVVAALAGIIVALLEVRSVEPPRPVAVPAQTGSLYTAEELAVMRLVAQGYIPREMLAGEPYRTKRLVNRGLIPRAAIDPALAPVAPLYTAEERALTDAVARGLIPKETLDTRTFLVKRLINQGLIPREAADGA